MTLHTAHQKALLFRAFLLFSAHLLFACSLVLTLPFSTALAESYSAQPPQPYPDDPFAVDRELLPATAIGTARGQTRLTALGALVHGRNSSEDFYLGGKISMEFMLHEFGSVRISGFQDLLERDIDFRKFHFNYLNHRFSSLRVGPALHLSPYRRVDAGPYLEAGALMIDPFKGNSSIAPEVTMGGFITIHLNSAWYLQLELERAFAYAEVGGVFASQHRTAALFGLGLTF
jgi:hypothetical protein